MTAAPHSVETEQRALACMLERDADATKGLAMLSEEHFYLSAHKNIFNSIKHLASKEIRICIVNIYEYLKAAGQESITSLSYVAEIANLAVAVVSIEDCYAVLHEKLVARSLVNTASKHIELAQKQDLTEIFSKIRSDYESLEKVSVGLCGEELAPILEAALFSIEKRREAYLGGVTCAGVPTGFKKFDEKLGGLSPSNLIIGAARPGMGKTALILNMIENIAIKAQRPVGFFSLEMSRSEIMDRLLSGITDVPIIRLRNGDLTEQEILLLKERVEKVKESPLIVDDAPYQTIATLGAKAIQMKNKYDIQAIFIDYLQLISDMRGNASNRYMEITEISRRLKCLAKQLDIPVVCLSQLSRSVEQRADKTPQLSDLRDSGAIEQDADIVFFIHRKGYYDPYDLTCKIIIAKNRHGQQGEVKVTFNKMCCRFEEAT